MSEVVMDAAELLRILPHRYPFLLLDRILSVNDGPDLSSREGRKAVALKNVTLNEPFFVGHFPGRPIMPGVLLIEAMAQTGAMAVYRRGDQAMEVAIASIKDAKFRKPVTPGDQLKMTAEVLRDRGQMIFIGCKAEVDGQIVAEAQMLASFQVVSSKS